MDGNTEQKFDRMVDALQSGRLNRREFFRRGALLGVSLATVTQVLSANKMFGGEAQAAYTLPADWNPYPHKWGMDPIASTPEEAVEWWLARMKDSSAPDSDPSALLTDAEIAELKGMGPAVGHSWYDLAIPAVAGWNQFWKEGVSKWASDIQVYDNQAKPERMLLGTEFQINQGIKVAGSLAFDWILFGESMKRFHEANVATTSVATSPSAYYPPTCVCMGNDVADFQKMVMPIAKFFRDKGNKEIDAVWLVEAHPSWFSISRQKGFQAGLDDPAVQEVCKINIVDTKPVLENDDTQAAAEAALQQHPTIQLFIMLAHQYVGAAAAVRSAQRKDVYVAASDLDEGTATSLLHGNWPILITYSLPISGSGYADANVMGKILLGKRVPLIVTSQGTVTTSENVKEAYAKDWGGAEIPWK
jgi:ABC-type sugar transport system substrate-binding protein